MAIKSRVKTKFRSRDRDDDRPKKKFGRGSFKYRPRDPSTVAKRQNQGGEGFDRILKSSVKMWSPKEGDHTVRFLPPTWEDPKHYGLDVYLHYGIGPDSSSYLCLNKGEKTGPCPICKEYARVARSDSDEAKQLAPKKRVLTYIIDRNDERAGVQAWLQPWMLDQEIALQMYDKRTGETLNLDDPDSGYDVDFVRQGSGLKTKYVGAKVARRASELLDDPRKKEKAIEFIEENPLPDILEYREPSYLKKVMNAEIEEDDDAKEDDGDYDPDDDDEKTSSRRRVRSRDDDEEDEESEKEDTGSGDDEKEDDEEYEEEDEEEDEKPRRRRVKVRRHSRR